MISFLIFSSCFSPGIALAAEYNEYEPVTSNTEFAQKTAEIIKNDSDESSMLRIIGKLQPAADFEFPYVSDCVIAKDGRFVLQFSSENKLLACLKKLNSNPDIIYAERDQAVFTETAEETVEHLSWGVEAIEADIYSNAIASSVSDNSVTVAIVDSGSEDIDFIKDRLIKGYDFFENDEDAYQDESVDSHGTFLASIVADCTRNLPVKIMPVRVLNSKNASMINVINEIIYAVDNGADVINISLGANLNNCNALEDATAYADKNNVSVVVCSGNLKTDIENFCPAHIDSVITVSSVDQTNGFSEAFSNFGNEVDLAAPGENITGYSASGQLIALSGTSMSAAFVSAAAAMFRLDNPACNNSQVRDALISCTEDFGETGWDKYYGWGIPKLGSLLNSDIKHVESISFSQDSYALFEGDTLEIEPEFYPADASDKSYTLSSSNGNVSIKGNVITAVSEGTAILTVTSNDGNYSDTAEIVISKTANEIIAKLVDADGLPVINSQGSEVSDTENVTVKSGLLQKIISFFKNLFRLNRTVVQLVFKD